MYNLKESEEKYKRINIQIDLSISELEAFQKIVAEEKKIIRHVRTQKYIMLYE